MVGMLAKKVLAAGVGLDLRSARQKQETADRQDDMQRCREEQPRTTARLGRPKSSTSKSVAHTARTGQAATAAVEARDEGVWNNKNRQNQRWFALGRSTTVNDNGLGWGSGSRAPGKLDGFPNTACRLGTPGAVEGGVESAGRSKQETTVKVTGRGLVGVRASRVEFGTQPKGIKSASKVKSRAGKHLGPDPCSA